MKRVRYDYCMLVTCSNEIDGLRRANGDREVIIAVLSH
jgi:hypothetical protein